MKIYAIVGCAVSLVLSAPANAGHSKGGHYVGGTGSHHKGSHYVNYRTGNHYGCKKRCR